MSISGNFLLCGPLSHPSIHNLVLRVGKRYTGDEGDGTQGDFSATQRCNIVATLFRIVTTLFQHCNASSRSLERAGVGEGVEDIKNLNSTSFSKELP